MDIEAQIRRDLLEIEERNRAIDARAELRRIQEEEDEKLRVGLSEKREFLLRALQYVQQVQASAVKSDGASSTEAASPPHTHIQLSPEVARRLLHSQPRRDPRIGLTDEEMAILGNWLYPHKGTSMAKILFAIWELFLDSKKAPKPAIVDVLQHYDEQVNLKSIGEIMSRMLRADQIEKIYDREEDAYVYKFGEKWRTVVNIENLTE